DPARAVARRRYGELLFERAVVAERERQRDTVAELLARMALYDDDGALARRWRGPATVTLESDPPGARVTAVRYVARGEHLVTEPLDPGAATPIVGLEVPAGSLRFTVAAPGRATVELPVALGRGDEAKLA